MKNRSKPDSLLLATHNIRHTSLNNVAFRLLDVSAYIENHRHFPDHRHGFFELIFIANGGGMHTIDFEDYFIQPNSLFLISPGQVHNFKDGIINEGFVMIFERDYLAQHQKDNEMLMRLVACGLQRPLISVEEREEMHFRNCRDLISDELSKSDPDYEIIRSALKILLIKALQFGQQQLELSLNNSGLHKKPYFDFLLLIESNFTRRHEVSYYTDELMLSPKQLTVITKAISGKTALQEIHERVVTEAKRLLFYSDLSVKEIAVCLGFEDPSYFSRFFFQKAGVTPKEFQTRNPKSTL